jgi:hypothetical protein
MGHYELTKTTGVDGVIELPFLGSNISLNVAKPGFAIETRELSQWWGDHQDFQTGVPFETRFDLVPDAGLSGVVRGPEGRALAGIQVAVREFRVRPDGEEHETNEIAPRVETDLLGRWTFHGVRAGGRYSVCAEPKESLLWTKKTFVPPAEDCEIVMRREARIACKTTVARDELVAPHSSPTNRLALQIWEEHQGWCHDRLGDVEGTFRRLDAGRYRVIVADPTLAPTTSREVVLAEGDAIEVEVELTRGRRVAGRVVSASGPESRASISVNGRHEHPEIAPDGSFVLEHVPPGESELEVTGDGGEARLAIPAGAISVPVITLAERH